MKFSFSKTGAGFTPSFTLLELLIVIGIIAVLGSVTFIALNPVETLRTGRDTQRFADLDALNKAVNMAVIENTSTSLGTASTVYVSLPDASATCGSWSLPSLPTGWAYHCAASSTYTLTNGTGWLPVNLAALSTGSPVSHDPLDPTNDATHYYQYVPNPSQTTWELASVMESSKYKMGGSNDKTSTDGGGNVSLYEKGTDLTLVPVDSGDSSLVGWWPLNEGSGTVAYDRSGKGNNGTWAGTPAGDNGTYYTTSGGKPVGEFNGSDDYVISSTTTTVLPATAPISVSFWEDWSGILITNCSGDGVIGTNYGYSFPVGVRHGSYCYEGANGKITGSFESNSNTYLPYGPIDSSSAANQWRFYVLTNDGSTSTLYSNGSLVQSISATPYQSPAGGNITFGGVEWAGRFDLANTILRDIRIYKKVLSQQEIQAIYNATR